MYESLISIYNMLPKYYVKTPVCLEINIFHLFIFIMAIGNKIMTMKIVTLFSYLEEAK